ncbi:type II toxin-antitoxin system BrnA family antitoxin [Roseovarius tibetensis]|uniref:type II toxin-antitoxin system BrnA family antitoxin n=1 Tax=Roseovarius tibetensis TaxID=2685897 RepID=UPI003D7F2C54
MKATEFDERFDAGEDISAEVDWTRARRLNVEAKRVNVDFPSWVVEGLDRQAQKLGISRQALIKMWIAERLER